jgi:hypothetical protein
MWGCGAVRLSLQCADVMSTSAKKNSHAATQELHGALSNFIRDKTELIFC